MSHRSRLCHVVIDVDDLDEGVTFGAAALDATDEELSASSRPVYRRLKLPDSEIRILLQRTTDPKTHKERMHLDLESDDIDAEVRRLESIGATRHEHQQERGYSFWVLQDPWGNELRPQREPRVAACRPSSYSGSDGEVRGSDHKLASVRAAGAEPPGGG